MRHNRSEYSKGFEERKGTSIHEFISHANKQTGRGFARENAFKVDIIGAPVGKEDARAVSMMAQTATFPDVALAADKSLSINNTPEFSIASSANWANIDFTFLVSDNFRERNFFEDWVDFIYNRDKGTVKYFDEYASASIEISYMRNPLDKTPNPLDYKIVMKDVYPTSVGEVTLNVASVDTISTMSVNLHYTNFKRMPNTSTP
jgi:hypothetical protein